MTEPRKIFLVFVIIMAIGLVFWAIETAMAWSRRQFKGGGLVDALILIGLAVITLGGLGYIALKLLGVV